MTKYEELAQVTAREIAEGEETPMNALANGNHRVSRRTFLHSSIVGVSALALTGCVNGIVTRGDIEVTQTTINLPNLPEKWKGKKITHLTDIHSSPFMSLSDLKRVVKVTNEINSDVILMTGDFVTSHRNEIGPFVEAMSELHAPMGVYASTGNHDYYTDVDLVSKGMEDIGITMMRNACVKLEHDGAPLYIVGVDDEDDPTVKEYVKGGHAPHIEAAYKGLPEDGASILLCHKPYRFEEYAKTNIGLMLSGHTHGGQIVFGRLGRTVLSISSVASGFIEGHYRPEESDSKSQLYVSRGLGTVGLPLRLNCPPEVAQITLA
ncbi:MAG TPA: metallophosphoesterase [Candidatus Kapabacteria bacterium]|nr:metallophosphoesterase [Candidatus Kapabacteria bacterium]